MLGRQLAGSAPIERADTVPVDLEARLLGPFEVRCCGGDLAPWRSQRAASMLKYLLLHRTRPVRRDVLMEAFWPASSAKSARNNLNVTLYHLRGQLRARDPERTHIEYSAGCYRLAHNLTCRLDVEQYVDAVLCAQHAEGDGDWPAARAWYERALSLYGGPFLEDDASGDWYVDTQRRLHVEHCMALERYGELLLRLGAPADAAAAGDELLRADPCRETAYQLLMRAYAALAQPQLVSQMFQRCQAMLRSELAIDPAPTTVELYRSLVERSWTGSRTD